MARPSWNDLNEKVKALEAQLAARPATEDSARSMPHFVRGKLKQIVRQPHRAVELAEQALRRM